MKTVILAGGFGTRISEESQFKPKPMIEVGGMPVLWHIMKEYTRYGHREFIICAGYKQEVIKKWFADYFLYNSDVTFDFSAGNQMTVHQTHTEDWKVTIVDTGLHTMTGGRIKRIRPYLDGGTFLMTYGDGVSDVDLDALIRTHQEHGKLATLTAVLPDGRFGVMDMDGDQIRSFREKSQTDVDWINGGYMVLEPEVLDYIEGDATSFEREPLERLAADGQLMCYRHHGFWRCMDTLQDKQKLEELWSTGQAPWKTWI